MDFEIDPDGLLDRNPFGRKFLGEFEADPDEFYLPKKQIESHGERTAIYNVWGVMGRL